jgi:hypothetical protein
MKNFVLLTAFLLAFAAQSHAKQPCSARAGNGLRVAKNYDSLLNSASGEAVKAPTKAKGAR